jgi:hypothetical protein
MGEIGVEREVGRGVALVGDDGEAVVDDMAVAVEQAAGGLRRGGRGDAGGEEGAPADEHVEVPRDVAGHVFVPFAETGYPQRPRWSQRRPAA